MAIVIRPRNDVAPIRGQVIENTAPFRPPSSIEHTESHQAIVQEVHENTVQMMGIAWQQEQSNKISHGLMVSMSSHMVQAAVEIEEIAGLGSGLSEGTADILSRVLAATLTFGTDTIYRSNIDSMKNVGEVATRVPTGKAILAGWQRERERQEEQERHERERRERMAQPPPRSLVDVILGRR